LGRIAPRGVEPNKKFSFFKQVQRLFFLRLEKTPARAPYNRNRFRNFFLSSQPQNRRVIAASEPKRDRGHKTEQ